MLLPARVASGVSRSVARGVARGVVAGGEGGGFTISSFTVRANGTTCDLVFNRAAFQGASFSIADLTATTSTTGAKTFTYTSGNESNAWVVEASEEIGALETGTVTWAGTANGIEDEEGEDLAEQTKAITNNSNVFFSNENFEYELDFNFAA